MSAVVQNKTALCRLHLRSSTKYDTATSTRLTPEVKAAIHNRKKNSPAHNQPRGILFKYRRENMEYQTCSFLGIKAHGKYGGEYCQSGDDGDQRI